MSKKINVTLRVWRQKSVNERGSFEEYIANGIDEEASFLEMLDIVNEELLKSKKDPIAFAHDCREGICGTCGAVINGEAHGPRAKNTLCQLHMRSFNDGDTIVIEPFRARAMPIIKDLVVDRNSMDKVIQAGGYISVRTGSAQDANALPIAKKLADQAFDAAQCIGCGACVAACPNASAMLFLSAKVSHLGSVPQGKVEQKNRVLNMSSEMEKQGFGACSNEYQCEAACPKGISVKYIAKLNKDYLSANLLSDS